MTILARAARIRCDLVRIPVMMVLLPPTLIEFGIMLLRHQPRRFFTIEPWANTAAVWYAIIVGGLAGED